MCQYFLVVQDKFRIVQLQHDHDFTHLIDTITNPQDSTNTSVKQSLTRNINQRTSNKNMVNLTWPSSSSTRHILASKRLHIRSTKLCPITLNSMTRQPTSNIVKEDLTVKHEKPQPTNLNEEDKILDQLFQTQSIS